LISMTKKDIQLIPKRETHSYQISWEISHRFLEVRTSKNTSESRYKRN
jgi:hypothetical protein